MIGRRVKLIYTNYQGKGSEIKPGDTGIIKEVTKLPDRLGGKRQIWIKWENNSKSTMALIEGEDRFEVL